ncbi:MAG: glycosyltransferase family 2 protein [Lachnospiraceae bacterium]|nr:glycosyltransferase family 2 protein [Lachnospiraceae bacterium]
MEKPLVTIIIPVYNIEDYLGRCVRSVLSQTYQNLEILLVDDGSTDGSGKLCDELAKEDSRIQVFHKENGGSSSARNLAIEVAKGSYLGFVDSDDYVEPDMYEQLVDALLRHHAQIAQVGRDEIDEQGNLRPNICQPPKEEEFVTAPVFFKELLMHRGDCSFCTKLVARELFDVYRFPIGELNEDFKILIQMLSHVKGVVSLPKQSYHVFYRMGSNTRKKSKEDFSRVFADNVRNAQLALDLAKERCQMEGYKELGLLAIAKRFGLVQRLDYMLHIPISQMTRDNVFYREVVKDIRSNFGQILVNPHLSMKNRIYLALFAAMPKTIRVIHSKIKGNGYKGEK